jgi:deoxyribodipyrimidine photo-lyase
MSSTHRSTWNYALQYAVSQAQQLALPLVVLETYVPPASAPDRRFLDFVFAGMTDNAARFQRAPVTHYPYLASNTRDAVSLAQALATSAAQVVTDDFPCQEQDAHLSRLARTVPVPLTAIDSNGLLPLRAAPKIFSTAYSFRRFLQQELPVHLLEAPVPDPLKRLRLPRLENLPKEITGRFPLQNLSDSTAIIHAANTIPLRGGMNAANRTLNEFLTGKLTRYGDDRNHPDLDATSNLSPYLHFSHISTHQIFAEICAHERWEVSRLSSRADGRRESWWGMSPSAEAFLDQLITWRELGYNMAWQDSHYTEYSSLPEWARLTLAHHEKDVRPYLYSYDQLEAAETHDPLWNAAQRQLRLEGRLHNYLRMLWGKHILSWTPAPEVAFETMTELNNRYALDGSNPNSYTGIAWCLGRYDHPWGPTRPIFGTVRYMSSSNTLRKVRVREYLNRYCC